MSTKHTIAALLLIVIGGIFISYLITKPVEKLKIYKISDINPELVDDTISHKRGIHQIADFQLINQKGKLITQKNIEGKILISDFFFTTCPSICPVMSKQMKRVYDEFIKDDRILLLSHTVMPEIDSAQALNEYAKSLGIEYDDKWMFLTGEKKHIYELARLSYFAVLTKGNGDPHDFIHTENFVLVDTKKRIRGFYDGTDKLDIDRLINDIYILLKEK